MMARAAQVTNLAQSSATVRLNESAQPGVAAGSTDTGRLAEVLAEFARTMVSDFPIQAILDRLVERIVEVLPVTAAGVMLIGSGAVPVRVAASSSRALRFQGLQAKLGEGPCLDAYRTGQPVVVGDVNVDVRFARFSPGARAAGLGAVFAFPLRHGDMRLGALDLYCDVPTRLRSDAVAAAQTLADVAAAYILNARTRDDLRTAVDAARADSRRDGLTGLGNRGQVIDELRQVVRRARRPGHTVAVLYADLDQFKQVNDTYGHRVGDELLMAVAHRLAGVVRPGDSVGRMSGDEFVIICDDVATIAQADGFARRVVAALGVPYALSAVVLTISASVGMAYTARGDLNPHDILHAADLAMYQVKQQGGRGHHTAEIDQPGLDELAGRHRSDDRTDMPVWSAPDAVDRRDHRQASGPPGPAGTSS